MRKFVRHWVFACLTATGLHAGGLAQPAAQPLAELPYTPGLDVSAMDRNADPCTDFYQYACGGWIKNNPIPQDQSSWSVYGKTAQANSQFLWGILQSLTQAGAARTAGQQKLGDYFAACMDDATIEQRKLAPLQPYLDRINQLSSKQQLPAVLAQLQLDLSNDGFFFSFNSGQDFADSNQVIAFANSGGLSLPERDYYLKTDAKSKTERRQYLAHAARMFALLGDSPGSAQAHAKTILDVETALAKATLNQVDQRDPYKQFHKVKLAKLQALTPGFDWTAYLQALGTPTQDTVNISEPAFYKALGQLWQSQSLDTLKTYLRWHTLNAMAPYLTKAVADENFEFFQKTLRGQPQQKPRWSRCTTLTDIQLGEALGQEFVNRTFGPEIKERTLHMTRQIEQAMAQEIATLDWMGPTTKQFALKKLAAVVNKVGYPDRWRDYSAYTVVSDDFAGNIVRGNRFEVLRQLAKIGQPLDRSEWGMTPPTVDAYYNQQTNDINFPAGILQPPAFDPKMDDAPNYGNTGATIGHELTHAFDDQGRKYDAQGSLKNWWTGKDGKAFEQRAQCLVDQYNHYTAVDDVKVNGKLTLGENVADLGGVVLAWLAWKVQIAEHPATSADGLSPEQRFFVGTAQWACENTRPENQRLLALTDPHSPGRYRVNGPLANVPEFAKAFACKPGQPMVRDKLCKIW